MLLLDKLMCCTPLFGAWGGVGRHTAGPAIVHGRVYARESARDREVPLRCGAVLIRVQGTRVAVWSGEQKYQGNIDDHYIREISDYR